MSKKEYHNKTATLAATETALVTAAGNGRMNIDNLIVFADFYESTEDRSNFLTRLYNNCSGVHKMELDEICVIKDWKLNKDEEE